MSFTSDFIDATVTTVVKVCCWLFEACRAQFSFIRVDISFFGSVGSILGVSMLCIEFANKRGVGIDDEFLPSLLFDFVAFRPIVVMVFALAILTAIRNLSKYYLKRSAWLDRVASHSSMRLMQFTSIAVCAGLGFSVALLVLSYFCNVQLGIETAKKFLVLVLAIFSVSTLGAAIATEIPKKDEVAASWGLLAATLVYITFLALAGFDESSAPRSDACQLQSIYALGVAKDGDVPQSFKRSENV